MLFGAEHVKKYLETDGKDGHDWRRGAPILLLWTVGRRSGKERVHPLIYQQSDDGSYLIVASNGGDDEAPGWYHNLSANPEVTVQVWGDRFKARARTATVEEKPALWARMAAVWPDYNRYQAKTARQIPVVVLERL
jgi:deazaflavin-dependent oxidoreductase (nitroreductase family)